MIQQLLSLFDLQVTQEINYSKTGCLNYYRKNIKNFRWSMYATLVLTLIWIIYKIFNYNTTITRPHNLFFPDTYFGKLFMPVFPTPLLFYGVSSIAILLVIARLLSYDFLPIRIILCFTLLWINNFQWSFGFESHVGHFMLYVFIFSIFIPLSEKNKLKTENELKITSKLISWFYLGLLLHYTFSALWKWAGLFYKILIKKGELHWLHPDAALFTAVKGYRSTDINFENILIIFKFPLVWQIGFIIVILIQTFSAYLAASIPPLRFWIGMLLIIFHQINWWAFDVEFVFTPFALITIFFPYYIFFKENYNFQSHWNKTEDISFYKRIYPNQDTDIFFGFYGWRQWIYDNHPILGSILYFPGMSFVFKNIKK